MLNCTTIAERTNSNIECIIIIIIYIINLTQDCCH